MGYTRKVFVHINEAYLFLLHCKLNVFLWGQVKKGLNFKMKYLDRRSLQLRCNISSVYFYLIFNGQMESLIKNNHFGLYKINHDYFLCRFHEFLIQLHYTKDKSQNYSILSFAL
jgi:hypothetical protein